MPSTRVPFWLVGSKVEAGAIVADLEAYVVAVDLEHHANRVRLGVLHHVVHGLAHDPVDGFLNPNLHVWLLARRPLDADPMAGLQGVHLPPDSVDQPLALQRVGVLAVLVV
jgi:hypothetical protein